MTIITRLAWSIGFIACDLLVAQSALAQTPQQMEYERRQREQWQQQERQRQREDEIRRYNQQIEQERERREAAQKQQRADEEARKRSDQEYNQNFQDAQRRQQEAHRQGAGVGDQMEQARQSWQKRPPLPAERNPLLGKWTRPASARTNSSDPFAQLGAMLQGGLCELMFGGGGVFEFRSDRLVGSDARTREQELDRVEYRGDAKRVVVIPQTTFKLIVFDFEGPNRINWAGQDCVLVRVANR